MSYSPQGRKDLDTTEQLTLSVFQEPRKQSLNDTSTSTPGVHGLEGRL